MTTIYTTNKHYTVEQFNAIRLSINYDGEVVCKYDLTDESVQSMITDLVEFMIEDKLIKRKEEKEYRTAMNEEILPFVRVQLNKLAEEAEIRKIKEAERARERAERLALYGEEEREETYFGFVLHI